MSPREWNYLMADARVVARVRGERVRVYAIRGRSWVYVIGRPLVAASQDSLTSRETTRGDRETYDQPKPPAEWLAPFETGQRNQ